MKILKLVYSLLIIALFSTAVFAQEPADLPSEETDCGTKAANILTQPQCAGIDLSANDCTQDQMDKCFGGDNDNYNIYRCCTLDVSSKGGNPGKRKLKQSSSCFKLYTTASIEYESKNIVPILKYCISQGYKTNYSLVIGDPAVLAAIGEAPAPTEAQNDQKKSSASTLGFGAIAVAILALAVLL